MAPGMLPPRLAPPPVAPVAHGWTEHKAPDGRPYFYNSITRVSSYDRPPELKSPQEKAAAAAAAAAKTTPVVVTAAATSTAPPTTKAASPVPSTVPAAAAPAVVVAAVPPVVAAAPVAPKPAPAAPVVIPKCKWKAYDGPGGRKYYSDGKTSLWEKPKELKDYEAAVAAAAAATAKLSASIAPQPAPQVAASAEPASASPMATIEPSDKPAAASAAAEPPTLATRKAHVKVEPEPAVELVGFGGANGVALKIVEDTPSVSSPTKDASEEKSSPNPSHVNGNGVGKNNKNKRKAAPLKEYETDEEKKEAFVEMLKECEVTSTTKVSVRWLRMRRLSAWLFSLRLGLLYGSLSRCVTEGE